MNPPIPTADTRLRDLTVAEFMGLVRSIDTPRRFVTGAKNIAEYFGVSEDTVARWADRGALNGAITREGRVLMLDTNKL